MTHRVIGTSPARPDAWEKVRGRPIYAGDLALAGMLHGRIMRSPYASARIVRIDTRAARALPGVIAVLTDRKSTRLNSSHRTISYAVFCLKKKKAIHQHVVTQQTLNVQ